MEGVGGESCAANCEAHLLHFFSPPPSAGSWRVVSRLLQCFAHPHDMRFYVLFFCVAAPVEIERRLPPSRMKTHHYESASTPWAWHASSGPSRWPPSASLSLREWIPPYIGNSCPPADIVVNGICYVVYFIYIIAKIPIIDLLRGHTLAVDFPLCCWWKAVCCTRRFRNYWCSAAFEVQMTHDSLSRFLCIVPLLACYHRKLLCIVPLLAYCHRTPCIVSNTAIGQLKYYLLCLSSFLTPIPSPPLSPPHHFAVSLGPFKIERGVDRACALGFMMFFLRAILIPFAIAGTLLWSLSKSFRWERGTRIIDYLCRFCCWAQLSPSLLPSLPRQQVLPSL